MAARPRHVDPTRPRGRLYRAYASLSTTALALAVSRLVGWRLDPFLLALTRGRLSTALVLPAELLETTGARSGARRRNAVLYFHDDGVVTVVASLAGADRHPAWFHNLVAHPDVTFAGLPMQASVVQDQDERRRLWGLADRVFPPFATYRRRAAASGREIPIVQLQPVSPR